MGLEEQIIFPEVNYDQIDSIRGLQVVFVTSAETDAAAFRLLELLGMPFEKEETQAK
jgi:large subunit ribosomal protein L5